MIAGSTSRSFDEIIDAHVHFFPQRLFNAIWNYFEKNYWRIHERTYAEEFPKVLGEFGVSHYTSLLYAHKKDISRGLNNYISTMAKKDPHIIPFGTIHPEDAYYKEELERILSQGPGGLDFKGIKLHLIVTNFDPNVAKLDYLYEKLIEFGKILVIHIGTGPLPEYCLNKDLKLSPNVGVKKLSALLERFPELKVQVPHLGAVEFDEMFGLLESYRNLYFDTAMMLIDHKIFPSGVSSSSNNIPDIKKPYNSRRTLVLPQENLRKLILKYHRRVLFGSDFPNIPYSYEFIIDQMSNLVISGDRNENRKILENIMFKNAKRLYKL